MMSLLRTLALSLGSFTAARTSAQVPAAPLATWPERHYERKAEAMTVLTGWGAANVLVGGIGVAASDDEQTRQFHLMNAGWGAINAALGVFGGRSARRDRRADQPLDVVYADLRRTEKILLFNAGLDLGYVAGGAYLLERAKRPGSETAARDKGWGQAIVLQGVGLFVFDLLAYRHLHKGEGGLRIGGERGLEVRVR